MHYGRSATSHRIHNLRLLLHFLRLGKVEKSLTIPQDVVPKAFWHPMILEYEESTGRRSFFK